MRHLWQAWVPRPQDYWDSFGLPYRKQMTELVDKATPPGGSVLDFGCGAGVQTFLLRQRRPDLLIYAVDCNAQARNLTQVLMGADDRLRVIDTPAYVETFPTVDVIFSIFAVTYIEPQDIGKYLSAFHDRAETIILCEPTYLDDPPAIQPYHGMPTMGHRYPYPAWIAAGGWHVELHRLDPESMLNAITVATKETS